jgi:integrase
MKLNLPGLNWMSFRLAGGKKVTYYYPWRGDGAPRMTERFGTPEFITEYHRLHAERRAALGGGESVAQGPKLAGLLDRYQDSPKFRGLKPRTQLNYKKQLVLIRREFGDMPMKVFAKAETAQKARSMFCDWRDELTKKSVRQADYAVTVLGAALSWAQKSGHIPHNAGQNMERYYHGTRVDKIWPVETELLFYEKGPRRLGEALMLGVFTGQRESDLLALTWFQYDGTHLRLQQGKTDRRMQIKVAAPLKAMLDALKVERCPKPGDCILLTDKTGAPWSSTAGFYSSFKKAMQRLRITGLTFNDLRGTAATRLALAGCTVPEIAAITGHSLADVHEILDAHYLHRDTGLADNAIDKLERFWAGFTGGGAGVPAGEGGSIQGPAAVTNLGAERERRGGRDG